VKVPWAVACLLAVLLAAGCSNKQTVKPDGVGSAPTVSAASTAPWRGAGEAAPPIKEMSIAEGLVQPTSVSLPVAPTRGAEAAAGGEPSLTGPQYKLGPEDQIRVSVWENAQLTLDLVVRPDGKISMPLIQDVMAEGHTASELATQIQQKLTAFIKDPQVSVIVLQINAPKFYVIGNVVRPGTYPLRGETSVLQALSLAGGFTQFASLKSIKLIRNAGGKQEVRKINYYDVIGKGGKGNYLLNSGDTVVVP
jgi:polysaccharide export outer membrane protein